MTSVCAKKLTVIDIVKQQKIGNLAFFYTFHDFKPVSRPVAA